MTEAGTCLSQVENCRRFIRNSLGIHRYLLYLTARQKGYRKADRAQGSSSEEGTEWITV
jgi:hypothetical protein